ncbi:hypothetical protein LAUMK136_01414 [Mycobacterium attenuatum]|uniref:Uncharacterized protein n=1 Tax=Mycobacterium attenuatum TaxID=2341086 RepID=A0A498PS11_9MYCO|nr:hypothetical protein LAUMK136_01414 [Mycobacterium attenuatum]
MAPSASSNTVAAAPACMDALCAPAAAAFSQLAYGAAALAIAVAAQPCQESPTNAEVTDSNDAAAEDNSSASRCHEAAVASIGADPGPA